jgi:hypothetical protein
MNARRLQELIEEFEDLPQHRIANLYRRDELKPLQFEALFKPLRDRFPPQINWWRRKAPLIVLCERLPEISGEALAARLASALERPVPVRAIPPLSDAAAKTFVAGPADEQLMVTLGSGRYDASPSDRAASAANEALQAALDKLQAWLRVEAADWHKAEDQKALRQVARVVAALADEHSLALYLEDGSRLALFDEAARRALASPEPGKQLELLGEERFLFRHLDEELGPSEKELEKHLAALPAAWSSLPEGEQILVQVPLRAGGAEEPVWLKLERLVRHQSGDWRYVVEFPSDSLLAPQFRRGERATVWGYEIRDWKQVSSGGTM